MDTGPIGVALLAIGGFVSIIAAVLIAIRNARSKGRRAALGEADELEALLASCRAERLEAQGRIYALTSALIEHGIKPPA